MFDLGTVRRGLRLCRTWRWPGNPTSACRDRREWTNRTCCLSNITPPSAHGALGIREEGRGMQHFNETMTKNKMRERERSDRFDFCYLADPQIKLWESIRLWDRWISGSVPWQAACSCVVRGNGWMIKGRGARVEESWQVWRIVAAGLVWPNTSQKKSKQKNDLNLIYDKYQF